jgi:hypothetical protein
MRLDMTVTFGNVLQIGLTVAAIVVAYYALRERLVRIETQLAPIWSEWIERRKEPRRSEDRV